MSRIPYGQIPDPSPTVKALYDRFTKQGLVLTHKYVPDLGFSVYRINTQEGLPVKIGLKLEEVALFITEKEQA
jgi:hypothetical protein